MRATLLICTIILMAALLAACDDPSPIGDAETLPLAGLPRPTPSPFFLDTYGPLPEPTGPVIRTDFSYHDILLGFAFAGIDPASAQLSCSGPSAMRWTQCSILLANGRRMAAYVRGGAFIMEYR